MSRTLSKEEIDARMQELRNLKTLHEKSRKRNKAQEVEIQTLKKTVREMEETHQSEITSLRADIAELKETISRLTDTGTKHKFFLFGGNNINQSKKKKKKEKRSKSSYKRTAIREEDITDRKEYQCESCPECNGAVSASQESSIRFIEDIVFAPKTVTECTVHRHYCRDCKKLVTASMPLALPGMTIGINVVLYILLEHYRNRKTDKAIIESLATYHHFTISSGEITAIRHKVAQTLGGQYEKLVDAIKTSKVVYADESGFHIQDTQNGWCHFVCSPDKEAVRYIMTNTRGKGVIEDALGEDFNGTLVTDFLGNYQNLPGLHQVCWTHLDRDAKLYHLSQPEIQERELLYTRLSSIYRSIRTFKAKDWVIEKALRTHGRLRAKLITIYEYDWSDAECVKLAKRIKKYLQELLECILDPLVPPDNNFSERGLRNIVTHRKITNGVRTLKGARTYEVNKSVIETLRMREGDLMEEMKRLLFGGELLFCE